MSTKRPTRQHTRLLAAGLECVGDGMLHVLLGLDVGETLNGAEIVDNVLGLAEVDLIECVAHLVLHVFDHVSNVHDLPAHGTRDTRVVITTGQASPPALPIYTNKHLAVLLFVAHHTHPYRVQTTSHTCVDMGTSIIRFGVLISTHMHL